MKKDLDTTKKKYNEVSDKLSDRNRQHQKLQVFILIFTELILRNKFDFWNIYSLNHEYFESLAKFT